MRKTALNAQKARELAQKAGIIPGYGQWKWGLNKLRDSRGNLLEGKDLTKAKESLGKLPNNPYQKLVATERKQRLGIETGLTEADLNKPIIGNKGMISGSKFGFNPKNIRAHTHPADNKNRYAAYQSGELHKLQEISRINHPVLGASPSGLNYKEHVRISSAPTASPDVYKLKPGYSYKDFKPLKERVDKSYQITQEIQPLAHKTNSRQQRIMEAGDKSVKKPRRETILKVHQLLAKNMQNLETKGNEILKRHGIPREEMQKFNPEFGEFKDKLPFSGADAYMFYGRNKPHSIVRSSSNVEGVHKTRLKLPLGMRSVYFDTTPRKAK